MPKDSTCRFCGKPVSWPCTHCCYDCVIKDTPENRRNAKTVIKGDLGSITLPWEVAKAMAEDEAERKKK